MFKTLSVYGLDTKRCITHTVAQSIAICSTKPIKEGIHLKKWRSDNPL